MPKSSFYFSYLRITIIQLLKSQGFDRCSNAVIDALTDTTIRFLGLLLEKTAKYTASRGRSLGDVQIQDISEALTELKIITPCNLLDPYDVSPDNLQGIQNFESWFIGPCPDRARQVARPSKQYISEVNESLDPSTQFRAKNRIPEYMNSFKKQEEQIDSTNDFPLDEDWIRFNLRVELKRNQAHDSKLKNSILQPYISNVLEDVQGKNGVNGNGSTEKYATNYDFIITGPTPDKLMQYLPYINSDDEEEDDSYEEESEDYEEQDEDDGNSDNEHNKNDEYGKENQPDQTTPDFEYEEHIDEDDNRQKLKIRLNI
ncbi:BA75_00743T0 [Komagataella pastoris]|uniref:BA75_00743T0 n=1 Tax=Komagataella pastoris TaxID=4922 RepID=A0A1B2J8K4_PICPA|nr:BA75_00743T0 [Komagataella pastoris]